MQVTVPIPKARRVKTGRKTFKACRGCRRKRARCNGQNPCGRCSRLGNSCIYENRQLETKGMIRDERTALLAHNEACTVIMQALTNSKYNGQTIIALWRRKPIEQIAEALSALQLGNEHDHNILERFSQQELNSLMSAGPAAFSKRDAGNAVCQDGVSSAPLVSAGVEKLGSIPEDYFGSLTGTHFCLSSLGETKTFGDAESGCGLGLGSTLAMPHATDATTPQSQLYWSHSYSPILGNNERAPFDTPACFAQDERGLSASGSCSQRIYPFIDFGFQSKNEAHLKLMPFKTTYELLEIFFHEQYIPFPTIVKDLFWGDFMTGKKDYCSIALVRIMCCLACRIKDGYDIGPSVSLGNQLWDEASRLVRTVNSQKSIPNAQALGLMSQHQLGAGQYDSARALADDSVARLSLLFVDLDKEIRLKNSVQATNLYGAIALARMIRLIIAQFTTLLNGVGGFSMTLTSEEAADARVEQLLSSSRLNIIAQSDAGYQRPAIAFQLTEWLYSCISRSQIAVDGALPTHVKDTYRACLDWYHSTLKQRGGIYDAGPFIQEVVPSHPGVTWIVVVSANRSSMYHHFCLLTLLRPFCHVDSEEMMPVEICIESADSILSLTQISSQLEDFHLPCFVPLFVYAAGMVDENILLAGDGHFAGFGRTSTQVARNRGHNAASHHSTVDSLSATLGDYGTTRRSLIDRALEQLTQLSDIYPSAKKAALELQSTISRRGSKLAVGD